MSDIVPASGERAAIGGYLPQFDAFASFAYKEMIKGELNWIRVADPDAKKLDDVQYSTSSEIHAYQVKWTIAEDTFSYLNFKELFPLIVSSWKALKVKHAFENKPVFAHLLTNRILSKHDSIKVGKTKVGTFRNFFNEVWIPLKMGSDIGAKWIPIVEELKSLSALSEVEFSNFIEHFIFEPEYKPKPLSVSNVVGNQQQQDLVKLRGFILEKVADKNRPVQFEFNDLIRQLGWSSRFKTTFHHELIIDESKYSPIKTTLDELTEKVSTLNGGYIYLTGSPGSGKSTLVTQWAKSREERIIKYYAFDFTNPSSGENYRERGESVNLFFDLVFQLKEKGVRIGQVLPYSDLVYLKSVFDKQLLELGAEFKKNGKKTFLIIDGLDHLPREYKTTKSFLADLPHPESIPAGVYIIIGSQTIELSDLSEEIRSDWKSGNRSIKIAPLGKNDVFKLIEGAKFIVELSEEQKTKIYEKSTGHPLYLSYLIRRISESENVDEDIENLILIEGDIENYYKKIWNHIDKANTKLFEFLGLIARIKGMINPVFLHEWNFDRLVQKDFRERAKFLFDQSDQRWAFFHNSFRQFLIRETSLNEITEEFDPEVDKNYHKKLADFYKKSKKEPFWKKLFHLFQAEDYDTFIKEATPENFIDQLLQFRPVEQIKSDINLGIEIAKQFQKAPLLVRYLFALSELEQRLGILDPGAFIDEFLELDKGQIAKEHLRNENHLLCDEKFALNAAQSFIDFGDKEEAKILFTLATPVEIKADSITIENNHHFRDRIDIIVSWVMVACDFYESDEILTRINNIKYTEKIHKDSIDESAVDLRVRLIVNLGSKLINLKKWDDFFLVLKELDLSRKKERNHYFYLLENAIEESLIDNDFDRANFCLDLILEKVPCFNIKNEGRIRIADLIYKVRGDLSLVDQWIENIPQPSLPSYGDFGNGYDNSLSCFLPKLRLNKLLNLCGRSVSVIEVSPAAEKGTDEEVLVQFERMLCLIIGIYSEGIVGKKYEGGLLKRISPIVTFFYQDFPYRNNYWFSLNNIKGEYFKLLIEAVAKFSFRALNELGNHFFQEFKNRQEKWSSEIQRKIILYLIDHGFDHTLAKAQFERLEPFMLLNRDADGRVAECRLQAQGYFQFGDNMNAEKWIKAAIKESIDIGHRKDYQFNRWIDWMKRINKVEPQKANERTNWFLSRLHHLKEITEGPAFHNASEKLLHSTFEQDFTAGFKQLQWQLDKGLIHFEQAIGIFIEHYLREVKSIQEFLAIFHFYNEVFLFSATSYLESILELILQKGFELQQESFYKEHLSQLIYAIKINALEERRKRLLLKVDESVNNNGFEISDFHNEFILSNDDEKPEGVEYRNTLIVFPDAKEISEKEVLEKIRSTEDLIRLIRKEDEANSYFNWQKVFTQLPFSLSGNEIEAVSDSIKITNKAADFYYFLSKIALEAGEMLLAESLANKALLCSSDWGWIKFNDGGSRINSFKALKKIRPKETTKKAFEVFAHDIICRGYAKSYVTELEDILPVITNTYSISEIWVEVFGYVQRLMSNSIPDNDLPAITTENYSIEENFLILLIYLSNNPVSIVRERARKHLAFALKSRNDFAVERLRNLAKGADNEIDIFIDTLMFLSNIQTDVIKEFANELSGLAISKNYLIRKNALELLKIIVVTPPVSEQQKLPKIYSLHLELPVKTRMVFSERLDLNNPEDLVIPFGFLVETIAEKAGANEANLFYRIAAIMKKLDNPENWTVEYENGKRNRLEEISLKFPFLKDRVVTAKRAIMYAVGELIDSKMIGDDDVRYLLTTYDYKILFLPEIVKPTFIQTFKKKEDGYSFVDKDWVERISESERFSELLIDYQAGWKVIGEYSKVRSLNWGTASEEYMWQLAVSDHIPSKSSYIFASAFQLPTEEYFNYDGFGASLIIVRSHRFEQFNTKSTWLAINPSLAKYLGWQPDKTKLFSWKDEEGNLMVESIYWSNGNMETPPPHLSSEAGTGWFVVASEKALSQILEVGDQFIIEKSLSRYKYEGTARVENSTRKIIELN